MKRKLIVTAKDSEVKTLAEVEKFLHGLSSSVQKDSVTPNDTIRITIYGNVATCDGCDYRIEEFMSACQNRIPYKELTVNSCYSGKPKEEEMQNVKGMDFKMKYGRDDAYKVETPTFSFHVQHYSDQMIAGKTFPKREYFGGVEEVDR